MKKYASVCMLYVGSAANRLFGILALMIGVETLQFWLTMTRHPSWELKIVFLHSRIIWTMGVILVLWTMTWAMFSHAKAKYTLERLRISRRSTVLCHGACAAVSYILLWGVQVLLLLVLFHWYGVHTPPTQITIDCLGTAEIHTIHHYGPQTIAQMFYGVPVLHGLLPLGDWPFYVRNLVLVLALGGCCAAIPMTLERGKGGVVLLALVTGAVMWVFPAGMGWYQPLVIQGAFVVLLVLAAALYVVLSRADRKENKHHEET